MLLRKSPGTRGCVVAGGLGVLGHLLPHNVKEGVFIVGGIIYPTLELIDIYPGYTASSSASRID